MLARYGYGRSASASTLSMEDLHPNETSQGIAASFKVPQLPLLLHGLAPHQQYTVTAQIVLRYSIDQADLARVLIERNPKAVPPA